MAWRPVSLLISFAVSSQFSSFLLAITTSAPCLATAVAISLPKPRLPPVTTTTLPVRSNLVR